MLSDVYFTMFVLAQTGGLVAWFCLVVVTILVFVTDSPPFILPLLLVPWVCLAGQHLSGCLIVARWPLSVFLLLLTPHPGRKGRSLVPGTCHWLKFWGVLSYVVPNIFELSQMFHIPSLVDIRCRRGLDVVVLVVVNLVKFQPTR